MQKPIKHYIQDLIIETVYATRHLDTTIHIALSHKKMSQNKKSNTTNILHKRQLQIIKQIRRKLIKVITMKADKGRTVVITDKDAYQQKVAL